jgi:ABC-type amino acid transport substrate-binding protein
VSPSDLRDKTICALKSAFYLSQVEKMTGKALLTFKRVSFAEKALLSGKCVGLVYYDADLIYEKKSKKKWENFNIVRLNTPLSRWGLGVRRENRDTALGKLLSETVKDWRTKGTLLDLEKKWLGQTMNHLSEGIDKAKISQ